VLLHGVIPFELEDPVSAFVELLELPAGALLQPVEAHVSGSSTLRYLDNSFQSRLICVPAEDFSCPIVQLAGKAINSTGFYYTTSKWPTFRH